MQVFRLLVTEEQVHFEAIVYLIGTNKQCLNYDLFIILNKDGEYKYFT